ncbi:hypothetical protein ABEP18_26175 [Priestia megaterium]
MIKDIAALVQICFYIVGATIAILTYRSAKKGLLNTVNTEYQKRVMDHLHLLSEELYAEFNIESEFYYYSTIKDEKHDGRVQGFYPGLDEFLLSRKHAIEEFFSRTLIKDKESTIILKKTSAEARLERLSSKVKSDPFLPDHIADYVVSYLTKRLTITRKVIDEELKLFENQLFKAGEKLIPDEEVRDLRIRILHKLEKQGYDSSQVEIEVHNIRNMIKEHLKSFNPLK